MPEVPISPEAAEMLPRVVKDVSLLYVGDQIGRGLQKPQDRDGYWQKTAGEFPPFSEYIADLREASKKAEAIRAGYPALTIAGIELAFSSVQDELGRKALSDIMMARCSTVGGGNIESNVDFIEESEAIARELGIQEGTRAKAMGGVNLEKVIESILVGNLKLTRQTQPIKSGV